MVVNDVKGAKPLLVTNDMEIYSLHDFLSEEKNNRKSRNSYLSETGGHRESVGLLN